MIKKIVMMLLFAAPLSLFAQKYAHFDYATVMQALPDYKKVMTELETEGKKYQTELETMQKELQAKADKYQKEDTEATPENIRQRHQQELQDLYQRLMQAQQDNEEAFAKSKASKIQPVAQKVMDTVNAVAKEGSYVYIIDKAAAQNGGIFINESISVDVTKQVMQKLGISSTAAAPSK